MFIDEEEVVSSIIVVPIIVSSEPYGGLYVTHHMPWYEESGLSRGTAAVVALAGLLERLLLHHVAGQHVKTWQDMCEVSYVVLFSTVTFNSAPFAGSYVHEH